MVRFYFKAAFGAATIRESGRWLDFKGSVHVSVVAYVVMHVWSVRAHAITSQ